MVPAAELLLESRVYDTSMSSADFEAVWDAITRGSQGAAAVAITLHGGGEADAGGKRVLAAVSLVLPAPLAGGATYPISSAYLPESETAMPMYWDDWGARESERPGEAEIALRVFDYHANGMLVENDFVARSAAGTVRVLDRGGNAIQLRLDVTATDRSGATLRLYGDFELRAERFTPPPT